VTELGGLRFGEMCGKRFRATSRRSTENPKQVSSVFGAGDPVVMNTCSSTAGVALIDSPTRPKTRLGDEEKRRLIARRGRICTPSGGPLKGNLEAKSWVIQFSRLAIIADQSEKCPAQDHPHVRV
jgi:hypothetical protein